MAKDRALSDKEHKALELFHLGGVEAWRTPTYTVACNTVDSLVRKGYFNSKGLTAKGIEYVEKHVVPDHTQGG